MAPSRGPAPGSPEDAEPPHVASRLHAFNRFELKYLVPAEQAAEIRDELSERMDRDLNSPAGGYGVWSLYYDSPQLRFYWEKIEGLKFRRKLRIRHYGDLDGVSDESPVCVEIKQRVNRVTQKRRITLPYGTARQLCDAREMVEHSPKERGFVHEVLDLVVRLNLRPTAITGYQREALVGRDSDTGLRVTFDRRIRGRDRDFDFSVATPQNRFTLPPHMAVMEIKVNERTPYWITDLAARRNLNLVRVSKYVQSIEAFGLAPRSVFHVHEADCPPPSTPLGTRPPAHQAPVKAGAQ
ncbi:polyphosphate polymerase domain-containing protein [Streptomyces sp. NTK 937]|uniref:polyphosphate polymerase domain-containing protein n=1 Tax=Streptomyces TaxID=1883 RepID=UPI000690DAC9|nr:polyphosphate polymerase domain-containing protein [Streptomyces sp. NTK 937]WSX39917.1 polyphosphate polymerase domain-containing protein [Streptomyces halstedii]